MTTKPTDVVLIYYMDGKIKRYIKHSTWNNGRQIVDASTTDFNEAQKWEHINEAYTFLKTIPDDQEREYKTEWVTLDLPLDFRFWEPGTGFTPLNREQGTEQIIKQS